MRFLFPSRRFSANGNFILLLLAGALCAGCAKEARYKEETGYAGGERAAKTAWKEPLDRSRRSPAAGSEDFVSAQVPADDGKIPPTKPDVSRKIIYTADLQIIVEDLDAARKKVLQLVKQYNGYLASSDISGDPGSQRTARWTIRVPVDSFQDFRAELLASDFGYPQRNSLRSRDVTEEYYDLEQRIRNAQEEEKRLLQHLQKSTKDLKDILAVERELARVRGQIERMQGRLRVLQNLTALTTINLTLIERKDYQPPQEPTFGTTISRTFDESLESLIEFGKQIVLFFVALGPWLPVIAVVAAPILWLLHRVRRRIKPVFPPGGKS